MFKYKRLIAGFLLLLMTLLLLPVSFAEEESVVPVFEEEMESSEPGEIIVEEELPEEPEQTAEPEPAPSAVPTEAPTAVPTSTPEPAIEATEEPSGIAYMVKDRRVTMGADLTEVQKLAVYEDFGIPRGSVAELTVTNAEERAYLEGLVPDRKIGKVALSCCYITVLEKGSGLSVELKNINYCTKEMYLSALETAGITDARVMISAPYAVSGTGALTGIYKAYEDITGKSLSELAKLAGAEELVLTGELSEYIGSREATEIIRELKKTLDRAQGMTDEEVKEEILQIAKAYKVELTSSQLKQVLSLARKLQGLSEEELQRQLTGLARTAEKANSFKQTVDNVVETVSKTVTRVYEDVIDFFDSVGDFFTNLFSGNWKNNN